MEKLQDLLTRAVPKYGWWLNSNEIFNEGSRAPTLWIRIKATLLCSATCSILRSSASFSGLFEKLLFTSFAIFWASLKQLYVTRFCRTEKAELSLFHINVHICITFTKFKILTEMRAKRVDCSYESNVMLSGMQAFCRSSKCWKNLCRKICNL